MKIWLDIFQLKVGYNSITEALDKFYTLISSISIHENQILLLPEVWISGFDRQKLQYTAQYFDDIVNSLKILARKIGVNIVLPISRKVNRHSFKLYNSLIFISSKGLIEVIYNKIHLFPLTLEQNVFLAGKEPTIFNFNGIKIGFATCYDLRFPELFRFYALNKVRLILVSACFPEPRQNDWRILLQARAIENQLFICGVNAVGQDYYGEEYLTYFGHSMLIHPSGKILFELNNEEVTCQSCINISDIDELRSNISYLEDIADVY